METRHLIDAIVQQTTLLIAQLATSAGLRAPLANIADQVFLELANEIEQQGVSREVVADMFGLALRTYQKKVNRLRGSVTQSEQTLWESVLQEIRKRGSMTRQQVLVAFRIDEERHVIAVLNDLVASGLIYATGRGHQAAYGPTPTQHRQAMLQEQGLEALLHLVWLEIADRPGVSTQQLRDRFPESGELVDKALLALLEDGRVRTETADDGARYHTSRVTIPVGAEVGWEAAVFDHFRAVCVAIAGKLRNGGAASKNKHMIGGTTLCFETYPGHPDEAEVKNLLARFRSEANVVWNRVAERNQAHPVPDTQKTKVIFYFGQNVIEAGAAEEAT